MRPEHRTRRRCSSDRPPEGRKQCRGDCPRDTIASPQARPGSRWHPAAQGEPCGRRSPCGQGRLSWQCRFGEGRVGRGRRTRCSTHAFPLMGTLRSRSRISTAMAAFFCPTPGRRRACGRRLPRWACLPKCSPHRPRIGPSRCWPRPRPSPASSRRSGAVSVVFPRQR
jgi:hypothetical protein